MMLAIIGGEPLGSALDAVVAVRDADRAVACSGVLLGARHVLTAAHCASQAAGVAWGTDLVDGEAEDEREVVGSTVVEGWTEGDHDLDLAVLELVDDAPVPAWPLADGPPDPGDPVWIYGFGVAAEVGDTAGHKRGAELEVLEVGDGTLLSWNPLANACSGDSGGPAVARAGEGFAVVGVTTWVDPACLGGKAGATRADVWEGWLGSLIPDLSRDPLSPTGPTDHPGGCAHAPSVGPRWVVGILLARAMRKKCRTGSSRPRL